MENIEFVKSINIKTDFTFYQWWLKEQILDFLGELQIMTVRDHWITVVFWGYFGFKKIWSYHVIRILKCFILR